MRAQHLHTGLDGIKPDLGIRLLGLDLAAGDPDGVSLVLLKGHNAHFDWFQGTLLWSDQPTIFLTASQNLQSAGKLTKRRMPEPLADGAHDPKR